MGQIFKNYYSWIGKTIFRPLIELLLMVSNEREKWSDEENIKFHSKPRTLLSSQPLVGQLSSLSGKNSLFPNIFDRFFYKHSIDFFGTES